MSAQMPQPELGCWHAAGIGYYFNLTTWGALLTLRATGYYETQLSPELLVQFSWLLGVRENRTFCGVVERLASSSDSLVPEWLRNSFRWSSPSDSISEGSPTFERRAGKWIYRPKSIPDLRDCIGSPREITSYPDGELGKLIIRAAFDDADWIIEPDLSAVPLVAQQVCDALRIKFTMSPASHEMVSSYFAP